MTYVGGLLSSELDSATFSSPAPQDAAQIWDLVRNSPPLDQNSAYSYILLADHFRNTCVTARRQELIIGFISAYLVPSTPGVLFVWQVVVDPSFRGMGLAGRMLDELLARKETAGITELHTTVSPGNESSRSLFRSLARRLGVPLTERAGYGRELFPGGDHDDEPLLVIGPLK
ncbi:MAG: diaminobutyrate acetyltransferase [Nitrospinota bacterium]|nr:diaminobutyrate acetyltransferase [Nitrospinota bacterium]MDH5757767.1 diaminobutyrate acetyltransferase [Nitrospinota bacterium]